MAAPKASAQANAVHEQIVRNVIASMKTTCGRDVSQGVMSWEVAAMHLALRRDYESSDISYRGTNEDGVTLYAVTADSHPGARYHVEVHPITHPTCSCPAGRVGRPCKHAGLALAEWAAHFERARRRNARAWDRDDWRELCEIGAAYYDAMEAQGR